MIHSVDVCCWQLIEMPSATCWMWNESNRWGSPIVARVVACCYGIAWFQVGDDIQGPYFLPCGVVWSTCLTRKCPLKYSVTVLSGIGSRQKVRPIFHAISHRHMAYPSATAITDTRETRVLSGQICAVHWLLVAADNKVVTRCRYCSHHIPFQLTHQPAQEGWKSHQLEVAYGYKINSAPLWEAASLARPLLSRGPGLSPIAQIVHWMDLGGSVTHVWVSETVESHLNDSLRKTAIQLSNLIYYSPCDTNNDGIDQKSETRVHTKVLSCWASSRSRPQRFAVFIECK